MTITKLFACQPLRILSAFITGSCGTLAFSPFDIWPVAIISISGLLSVILNQNSKQACLLGFIWGCGLFNTGINWIYVCISQFSGLSCLINIILMVLLVAYLAIYPMLFAILLTWLCPHTSICRLVLGAPVLWSITEFLRSWILTGFPWLEFGYSQIDGPLKSIAPLLGVQAITFMLVMISGLIVYALAQKRMLPIIIAIVLLLLPWPWRSLHWYHTQPKRAINVTLVQGNITQLTKWKSNEISQTIDLYRQNTLLALNKQQLIIWPELAIPDYEIAQKNFLTILDKKLRQEHAWLITGIIDARPNRYGYNYYNSMIVLGENKPYHYKLSNRYDKHHLVPLGETIPLGNLLRSLAPLFNLSMSSFNPGPYIQLPLQVAGIKLTATICYEIILGRQVRDNLQSDTDLLLTIANDSWFGHSIGPWQHFQMARMRSLELGRPLLCSTNNGITAVINADGTPQAQLPQFIRGILRVCVIPTRGITPYAYTGTWPLWIIIIITGLTSLVSANYKLTCKIMYFLKKIHINK